MFLFLISCSVEPTSTAIVQLTATEEITQESAARVFVIGDIAESPTDIIETHLPLADYLVSHLGDYNIQESQIKVAPDIETMALWMENGEVDLYFDSPYPALIVSEQSGATPILRRWKGGVEEYHSVIFSLAENNFDSLDELNGQFIAFDSIYSTSGYMLPMAFLIEAGLNPSEMPSVDAEVASDEIGYIFTEDDDTSVQWVISGRVGAAVVDSGTYRDIPQETRDQLMILGETETLPRQIVVIRPGIDSNLLEAVRSLLLDMDQSEEGRLVLATFEETSRFDEFPGGADMALARMRELYDIVQN